MLEHVQLMFFLVLGVATGISGIDDAPADVRRWRRPVVLAAALCLVASMPTRLAHQRSSAKLAGRVIGAAEPTDVLDDTPYRVADRHSTWFLSSEARVVEIPLRLQPGAADGACTVDIGFDGRRANVVSPSPSLWMRSEFQLPADAGGRQWRQLTMDVNGPDCVLLVGPVIERR